MGLNGKSQLEADLGNSKFPKMTHSLDLPLDFSKPRGSTIS